MNTIWYQLVDVSISTLSINRLPHLFHSETKIVYQKENSFQYTRVLCTLSTIYILYINVKVNKYMRKRYAIGKQVLFFLFLLFPVLRVSHRKNISSIYFFLTVLNFSSWFFIFFLKTKFTNELILKSKQSFFFSFYRKQIETLYYSFICLKVHWNFSFSYLNVIYLWIFKVSIFTIIYQLKLRLKTVSMNSCFWIYSKLPFSKNTWWSFI